MARDINLIAGIRHDYDDNSIPLPGEYGRSMDGSWYCVPPSEPELIGNLSNHKIVEHEDGTITVTPSILITQSWRNLVWHGYIERGIWRKI